MRDALNSSGRAIFYSLCDGHDRGVAKWSGPIGNSWRTTKDIRDDWFDMISECISVHHLPVNTLHVDTLHVDTLHVDTLHVDTLHVDTLHVDTLHVDTRGHLTC